MSDRELASMIVLEMDDPRHARLTAHRLNYLHSCDDFYVSPGINCTYAVRKRPPPPPEMARLKAWIANGCKLAADQ